MEYSKIVNLLGNTPNRPSKFTAKNQFEINDDALGTNNSDAYKFFKGTIKVPKKAGAGQPENNNGNNPATAIFK